MDVAIRRFLEDESGPTAVEYAVLLALILLGCLAAVKALGGGSNGLWTRGVDKIVEEIGR